MASHQAYNGIYINRDSDQIIVGSDLTKTTTLHFQQPSANRTYTISDVGENCEFIMSTGDQTISGTKTFNEHVHFSNLSIGNPYKVYLVNENSNQNVYTLSDTGVDSSFLMTTSVNTQTVSSNLYLTGTISSAQLYDSTLLNSTISNSTLTGNITNTGTISGGTISGFILSSGTISSDAVIEGSVNYSDSTITDSTLSNTHLFGTLTNEGIIQNGTISNFVIDGGLITADVVVQAGGGGLISNVTLTNNTFTGTTVNVGTITYGTMTSPTLLMGNVIASDVTILRDIQTAYSITDYNMSNCTLTGTIVNQGTIESGTYQNVTLSGNNTVSGTLTGGSLLQITLTSNNTNSGTITGGYLNEVTITGNNVLVGSISGGTYSNTTLAGSIINLDTISGGVYSNITLLGDNYVYGTISDGTFSNNYIANSTLTGTITGGTFNQNYIINNNIVSSTFSNGTFSSDVIFDSNVADTITGGSYTNITISNSTLSGTITDGYYLSTTLLGNINYGTLSGGIINVDTLSGDILMDGTLSGGYLNNVSFTGNTILDGTISGHTFSGFTCVDLTNEGTITGGTFSDITLLNNTLSGTLSGGTITSVIQNPSSTGNSYIMGGNVGIGTTSPTSTLQVVGNMQATSGSVTTLVVTDDPTNSEIPLGSYGAYTLSTTSYIFDGTNTDPQVLLWSSPSFSQTITQTSGVFNVVNAGVYCVDLQLRVGTTVTCNIQVNVQSSVDGSTNWTTQYYGAKPSRSWGSWPANQMEYKNIFHLNVTTSMYWRIQLQVSTAVTVSFAAGEMSRINIYALGIANSSDVYALYQISTTTIAASANATLVYNATALASNNGVIGVSTNYFTFTTNGLYLFDVKVTSNTNASTVLIYSLVFHLATTTGAGSPSYTTELKDYFTIGDSIYARTIIPINLIRPPLNVNIKLLIGATSITLHTANSYVFIKRLDPEICYFGALYTSTTATTPVDLSFATQMENGIYLNSKTYDGSIIVIPTKGLYCFSLKLNNETVAGTNVATLYIYSSSDNTTWNLEQSSEMTNFPNSTWQGQSEISIFAMVNVTSLKRYWKCTFLCANNLTFSNYNGGVQYWSRLTIFGVTNPNRDNTTGVLNTKFYYPGELVFFKNYENLNWVTSQYWDTHLGGWRNPNVTVTNHAAITTVTNILRFVFKPKLSAYKSFLKFSLNGPYDLNSTTSQTVNIIVTYVNFNETFAHTLTEIGRNLTNPYNRILPYYNTFINSWGTLSYHTITVGVSATSGITLTYYSKWSASLIEFAI